MNNKSDRNPRPSSFELIALQLGCQDDEAAFDEHLRKIAAAEASHGTTANDEGEGGDPKVTAPARKGE